MVIKSELCPACKEESQWSKYCGCYVCPKCSQHFHKNQLLAKCFCGWNLQNEEILEDDIGIPIFDGETWEVDY